MQADSHSASRRKCAMHTAQARVIGSLRTKHRRLVDALHDTHEPLVALHDAEVEMLADACMPAQVFPTALIRLSDVVVCYALEPIDETHRKARAMSSVRQEQVISHVVLQASGITVTGDVHLPPDATLASYVTERSNAFLPMTSVRVSWAGGVSLAPDALVNSRMVSAFYTQSESFAFLAGREPARTAKADKRRQPTTAGPAQDRVWVPSTFDGRPWQLPVAQA